jgi:hypothetical protein
MKWIERQCRSLWYAVVHAENPHCLMCGSTVNIEAHHTVPIRVRQWMDRSSFEGREALYLS